jgi:hypothetical protein
VSNRELARTESDVRMNVKVSRRDFPLLTEEIARLPKGPRRTNRLAHLATLGLCWERAVAGTNTAVREPVAPPDVAAVMLSAVAPTYQRRLDAGQLAALLDGENDS